MVHEYKPPKELMSQTSRPYLSVVSDNHKSTKSNQIGGMSERARESALVPSDADSAIYRRRIDSKGPNSQTDGIKPQRRL